MRVVDRSLQKMVRADDSIKFSKEETADKIFGLGRNVYYGQYVFV